MKPTNRPCSECGGLNRTHTVRCKSRGYAAVGPHPDAPPREAAPGGPNAPGQALEMCCGGTCVRALCFIHSTEPRPAAPATPDYEAFDCALATPPAGWRLLGPDDPEVSTALIYATPDGGLVGVPRTGTISFKGSAPAAGEVKPERWVVGLDYPDGTFKPGALFEPSYATQAEAVAARQVAADRLYVHTWLWDVQRVP